MATGVGAAAQNKLRAARKAKAKRDAADPDGAYDAHFVVFALAVFAGLFYWFTTLDPVVQAEL